MLLVGQDVDFGKYGIARVTINDPNVTPESQRRREEAIIKACQDNIKYGRMPEGY